MLASFLFVRRERGVRGVLLVGHGCRAEPTLFMNAMKPCDGVSKGFEVHE